METIWIDGFDHMVTADLAAKYDATGSWSIVTSPVRTGTSCLRSFSSSTSGRKTFAGQQFRTLVFGGAFQSSAAGSTSNYIMEFVLTTSVQVRLVYLADGRLRLLRNLTELATGTVVIPTNAWAYIEIEAYIDDTNGWVKVYVDETLDISFTGDTQNLANNYCDGFTLGGQSNTYWDDLYVRGAAGNVSGGILGNCKVLTRMPQGAGTYGDLTSSSGGANYTNVDEATPNGDTDYNSSNTVGQKDTYDFAALADTGAIKAVQLATYAMKTDTGARSLKPYIKSGATEVAEAAQPLSTAYRYQTKVWDNDPNTAAAWTEAGLDAAEFGVEVAG